MYSIHYMEMRLYILQLRSKKIRVAKKGSGSRQIQKKKTIFKKTFASYRAPL